MSHSTEHYQVIVIGGGHAGTEAALAAARMGARTLLLTQSIDTLGQMSCNPAIGGIGKGHLVKEIDAMGGVMARAADHCGIHFRILNASKGAAVRATRAQIDRDLYRRHIRSVLDRQENLELFQQSVDDLIIEDGGERIAGVVTQMGARFYAPCVILTVGTFLGGCIHMGERRQTAGRAGDPPSIALARRLRELPLRVGRLKTGTPPRIDGRTIDYSQCEPQPGDEPVPVFAFLGDAAQHPKQIPCHITRTNPRTHDIIRAALHLSPMYNGGIESPGPRYCPSVEDKVVRFAERESHQIFIEPESLSSSEIYPNGISTSLPYEVQVELVRSINGFERAHITRPGYAIEYDFFDPRDLHPWLETHCIAGLFFAGQINGTTGYEEAASQGLLAGVNAALRVRETEPWYPRRDEAYLGVLVDDLNTRGAIEPYRMFTSRAEYRLMLREDNADLRLTPHARALGLIPDEHWRAFECRRESIERTRARLESLPMIANSDAARAVQQKTGASVGKARNLWQLLSSPAVDCAALHACGCLEEAIDPDVAQQLQYEARYAGYIVRQRAEIERNQASESLCLPADLDYRQVRGLSAEVAETLQVQRPATLGQATRIPGITPVAISLLRIHLKKAGISVLGRDDDALKGIADIAKVSQRQRA